MKGRRVSALFVIVLLSVIITPVASATAIPFTDETSVSASNKIKEVFLDPYLQEKSLTKPIDASDGETVPLDQEQLQAWLESDVFNGKIHLDLYENLSEIDPSEIISVLVTYDEDLPKERIITRISSKMEDVQVTFEGNFVPVLVCKLPAGQVMALEEVEGVKHIFANHKVELYQDRDRVTSKNFFDLQKETVDSPHLYLNESTGIVGAPQLWDLGINGSGAYIAIIDSGVNWTHPDLAGKVVLNVSFVPDEDPMDYLGHGTHVAGIVAGTGAASQGKFKGVAPGAYIMNIKAFNKDGYSYLEWILPALEMTLAVKPLVGVSMSWGAYPLPESHPINLYMVEFAKHNIIPVAAAGNEAYYWTVGTPANSPYVISVGATTKNDHLAFFTSKGPDPYTLRTLPAITAPGVGIVAPISGWLADYALDENPYYAPLSGTSMAAPHVAGAVALLSSAFPLASASALKAALILSADDIGRDINAMGAGRLNIYKAYEVLNSTHVFAGIHPRTITGVEAPFVARFPGDTDLFNLTVFTGIPLTDAHLVLTGNASQIFFVKRYELGALEDYTFVGANITIPVDIVPGLYMGTLELWNGTTLMAQTPIKIEVAEPIATMLWDDMHDYILGFQFLWQWYITYWQTVSAANIRVVPTSLAGFELIFRPAMFDAVLLMDPYWGFTDVDITTLIDYVKDGGNLFIIYGQRADLTRLDEVPREFGIEVIKLLYEYGYPLYSNEAIIPKPEHPAISGVDNFTVWMGWVSLDVSGGAVALAKVFDVVYYYELFTVIAAYELAPYIGRLLVVGNDYMFDDAWINTWWYVEFPYVIIDYTKVPDNPNLARTTALWAIGDVRSPTVSIVSPADGEYAKGVLSITVSAEDGESGIDRVEFYIDGALTFTDTEEPYELNWNTPELWDGVYSIEAIAYDKAGNTDSTSISVIVDNIGPALSIISPKSGAIVAGSVSVHFSVFDTNLLNVTYSINSGTPIEITGETSFMINTTTLTDGAHNVTITATDRAENSVTEALILVVDNTWPSASIIAPADGNYLKDIIFVNVTGDDVNFDKMELYISGELVQTWITTGMQTYSWNTSAYTDGSYAIKLVVYDEAGNMETAETTVTVDSTPPTAEIRKPTENTHIKGSYEVIIYGYDVNLNVIQLYVNESLVASWNVTGIYTYTWNTTNDGTYTLELLVRDKAENNVTDMVTVIVDNTKPSVSITSPGDGAELFGSVNINFTATDDNLDKVVLCINNATFNMTGEASYGWDTTAVGDGTHTIKLVAYDKAENANETAITVTTVNVKREVEAARNLYLGIGTPIGFIIGAIIVYAIVRRRPHF